MDRSQNEQPNEPKGWPEKAQEFLKEFYANNSAITAEEKIASLEKHLGGEHNIYAHEAVHRPDAKPGEEVYLKSIPEDQLKEVKVGALEHTLLEQAGLIDVKYF